MTKTSWSKLSTVTGATLLAVALVLGMLPSTASADTVEYTAQASGRGAEIALAGTVLLDDLTAPRVADNDRVPLPDGDDVAECDVDVDANECKTGPQFADVIGLPLLADLLSVGAVSQDAAVTNEGTSKACSGLVGPGGLISVDETPQGCTVADPQGPGGIVVDLAPAGLIRLRVDGVFAECSASAGDPLTGVAPSAQGEGLIANAVVDILVQPLPLLPPVYVPIASLPISSAPNSQILFPPALAALNGVVSLTVNEQASSEPGQIDVTALHLTVLGLIGPDSLLDVKVGQVSCGANAAVVIPGGDEVEIAFDTSGDITDTPDQLQPQTWNALGVTYTPEEDRAAAGVLVQLGDGVTADVARGLPAGCTALVHEGVPSVSCALGAVDADDPVDLTIPVLIGAGSPDPVTATAQAYGPTIDDDLSDVATATAGLNVVETFVGGDAGGAAVPNPDRTGLPGTIPGELVLSLPDYVDSAAYAGTDCTIQDPPVAVPASVYPAIAGNVVWECGDSIAADPSLAFTYADSAPATVVDPDLGRVLIVRTTAGDPPEAVFNSYYADLAFFVDQVPPSTTSSSTSTSSSSTSSSSTSSSSSSTSSSSTSSSSTSSTSSTAPTSSSSTPSTSGPSTSGPSTTVKGVQLAKTGAESDMTFAVALGVLGVGFIMTGQGMELGSGGGLLRRRRS